MTHTSVADRETAQKQDEPVLVKSVLSARVPVYCRAHTSALSDQTDLKRAPKPDHWRASADFVLASAAVETAGAALEA